MQHALKICLVLLFVASVNVNAATEGQVLDGPVEVIKRTSDAVLERISANRDGFRAEPAKLRILVDEMIVPHFDFPRMAQWVVGKHWRSANADEQQRFITQFKNLLVDTYSSALLEFTNERIVYYPLEDTGSKLVTVKTELVDGADSTPIIYKLHNRDTNWKVFDVQFDGVSLISTYRAEFGSEIRRSGIQGLITTLNERYPEGAN